jgi:hypothetical protein
VNRTFHAFLLALFLAAIGLTVFFHKLVTSDISLFPNQSYRSWYVEAKLSLDSTTALPTTESGQSTTLQFHIPISSPRYEIADEDFVNKGFDRQIEGEKTQIADSQCLTKTLKTAVILSFIEPLFAESRESHREPNKFPFQGGDWSIDSWLGLARTPSE